jgi:cytoskeletal protein CcmA (bactofilin family)
MWKKEGNGKNVATQAETGNSASHGNGNQDNIIAFVGKGVEFKGTITYDGTVRIDGQLEGEIHTEGVLLVGEEAVITAKVKAGTVISRGKITGDIVAKESVKLESPAELSGSVKSPKLSIEDGVLFNGTCEMAVAEVRELPREAVVRASGGNIKRA